MQYQGGKSRLAKSISTTMLVKSAHRKLYIEPFAGSMSVAERMVPFFGKSILSDTRADLIAMWQAIIDGWTPPTELTAEDYYRLKAEPDSPLRTFAGHGCSWAGKWWGGYARARATTRNFADESSRAAVRKATNIHRAELRSGDYRDVALDVTPDAVVYADPPYRDTLTYAGTAAFDSDAFWAVMTDWARTGAAVFVSEFSAPDDWFPVWTKERFNSTVGTALGESKPRVVDYLFMHRSQVGKSF